MLPVRSTTIWAALSVGVLAACDADTATRPLNSAQSSFQVSAAPSRFGRFTELADAAACVAPPATEAEFTTYQPFVLAPELTQSVAVTELTAFRPVAGLGADLPDMLAFNLTGPDQGRYLYRTHEVGQNGAVTVTDLKTGVTSLVDQQPHYENLDGIAWTPWGTLIFAEERTVANLKDPAVPNAVGGLLYEWNPRTRVTTPRPAFGARSHEGLRFDSDGALYGISESTPGVSGSGAIYKFVPHRRGDLSSGRLYALKVLDASSRTGRAQWVELDPTAAQIDSDAEAIAKGATGWGRPEDLEFIYNAKVERGRADVMYVAATSEALVLRIELYGKEAFVSNYVKEGVNVTGLQNPDNLEIDDDYNLYIVEDNGPGDIFVVGDSERKARIGARARRMASLADCSAEPTGLLYDPFRKAMWVHVQHAGGALRNDLMVRFDLARTH